MPIIFAQPDPMGSAASIGVGAGEAAATQKMAPTLAQLYEHIADLRQRGAMSGGGGGGSSSTSAGGGGVGPGYYGGGGSSDADVQAQANREQRADDLSFQAQQPDYVGQHIQQTEDFKRQQQKSQQDYQASVLAKLNGQDQSQNDASDQTQRAQPLPDFDAFDQRDMDAAKQTVNDIKSAQDNDTIGEDDPEALDKMAQANQTIADLQQKQQAATKFQQTQQRQQQVEGMAHQTSMAVINNKHLTDWMNGVLPSADEIPGMPKKHWKFDDKGVPVVDNEKERLSHQNHYYTMLQDQAKAAQQSKIKDAEAESKGEEQYLHHYGETAKMVDKREDEFMKEAKPEDARRRKDPDERAGVIGDHMEAMGLPRSLQDYRAAKKGQPLPSQQAQPQQSSGATKLSTKEGQQQSAYDFIKQLADRPMPTMPRRTINPPGPPGSLDQATKENEKVGFVPQF